MLLCGTGYYAAQARLFSVLRFVGKTPVCDIISNEPELLRCGDVSEHHTVKGGSNFNFPSADQNPGV